MSKLPGQGSGLLGKSIMNLGKVESLISIELPNSHGSAGDATEGSASPIGLTRKMELLAQPQGKKRLSAIGWEEELALAASALRQHVSINYGRRITIAYGFPTVTLGDSPEFEGVLNLKTRLTATKLEDVPEVCRFGCLLGNLPEEDHIWAGAWGQAAQARRSVSVALSEFAYLAAESRAFGA